MRILLLEDDAQIASGLVHLLRHLGREGVAVRTLAEAVAELSSGSPFEAAIVDCGLSNGEDGHDLIVWLRNHQPGVRRILTSALDRPSGFAEDPPRQLFLKKPFGYDKLKAIFSPAADCRTRKGDE